MPPVLDVEENFLGTGYSFLREEYIPGKTLSAAFLDAPEYWPKNFPNEIVRIYQSIQASSSTDIKDTWQDKIEGMLCPKGFKE